MPRYTKQLGRTPKTIVGSTALSTTNVAIEAKGQDILLKALNGNVWINTNETATSANGFLVTDEIFLNCDTLNIVSDVTGANYQYIIYEA